MLEAKEKYSESALNQLANAIKFYYEHVLNQPKEYYNIQRPKNIAESEFEFVWISTHGLIAKNKATTNKVVNACINQYTVVSLLMEKAINVSQS